MHKQNNKKNVAVIFGGKSVEHDISIITGVQTLNAINKTEYNIIPIYITKNQKWLTSPEFFNIKTFCKDSENLIKQSKNIGLLTDGYLCFYKKNKAIRNVKLDFAFLCTHGGNGENGALQGFLEMCGVNYSSPNVFSSAICMNKLATKILLKNCNVNVTKFITVYEENYAENWFSEIENKLKDFDFPLIVKPCNLGSSVGITYCTTKQKLKDAISLAFLFDSCVLVEEVIKNLREVNLSLFTTNNELKTSAIEEVNIKDDFLTFENKYLNSENSAKGMENTNRVIPAKLKRDVENKILEYGKIAYKVLMCKGIVRIDFLINNETNEVYLNEVNTIPGSLSNYLWVDKNYNFSKLLNEIIKINMNLTSNKITNFSSNVLSNFENTQKLSVKK